MSKSQIATGGIADDAVTSAKTSGVGITMADTWRLHTTFTTSAGTSFRTIESNL